MQSEIEFGKTRTEDRDFAEMKFPLKFLFYFFPNVARTKMGKKSQKEMPQTTRSFFYSNKTLEVTDNKGMDRRDFRELKIVISYVLFQR